VVLSALQAVNPTTFLERVLAASWLAEVDVAAAKPVFRELLKEFPEAPFLRATLSTYYVFPRVLGHF
jgi:hypothetical protein